MEIRNEELFEVRCLNENNLVIIYVPLRAIILKVKKDRKIAYILKELQTKNI